MATIFWGSHGVILIDYLQKGKIITGSYYTSLLDKLKVEPAAVFSAGKVMATVFGIVMELF